MSKRGRTEAETADARLRLMAARVIAQRRWPYVSNLLFNFKLVEVPHEQLPTMAVDDGLRLYYSPVFVAEQTPEALATVLLHECLHCLHQHGTRFHALNQPREDHPLWNVAGDAAINETLDEEKMPWPSVEPVRYSALKKYGVTMDMTTEGAYFAILDYREQHPQDQGLGSDCGSIIGGGSRGYELPRSDDTAPAVRSDQQDVIRDRVAHDIINHARDRGSVPAGLLRWAEGLLNPKVDWREALASRLRRDLAMIAGRRDYVYTRPSRRQEAMRLAGSQAILPAMRQPAPPRVACVIDTSGSIDEPQLREFLTEVSGITRASGVASGVTVIACDAEAYQPQRVRSAGDVAKIRLEGGGGTDMGVGIEAAALLRPTPHIVIVFTDGYTPWPDKQPRGIDATIVVLTDETQLSETPAWSRTITLN
jgi:predicted metal-dependent peptidase